MSTKLRDTRPPHGLMRWLLRAPVWLYRLGLGGLLGDRFLLLTHIGRKSGQLRQNVLEVVEHDEATGAYVIASGWGDKADWLAMSRRIRTCWSNRAGSASKRRRSDFRRSRLRPWPATMLVGTRLRSARSPAG